MGGLALGAVLLSALCSEPGGPRRGLMGVAPWRDSFAGLGQSAGSAPPEACGPAAAVLAPGSVHLALKEGEVFKAGSVSGKMGGFFL